LQNIIYDEKKEREMLLCIKRNKERGCKKNKTYIYRVEEKGRYIINIRDSDNESLYPYILYSIFACHIIYIITSSILILY
jgi:hypothetical protein